MVVVKSLNTYGIAGSSLQKESEEAAAGGDGISRSDLPKSTSKGSPASSSKMLVGLMSLCTILTLLWR